MSCLQYYILCQAWIIMSAFDFSFLIKLNIFNFRLKKTDYMDTSIPYHTVVEISPISKWEPGQKYCLRIATIECHYLIQV